MNEEILKLAHDFGLSSVSGTVPLVQIEAFYKFAYNKGVLRSAIMARNFWSNQLDQTEESAYDAIRELEMK